jgi:hypothetical protein
MVDVRLAGADYWAGRIADALARLESSGRIVAAPTAAELLDALAADWYVDRRHAVAGARPSRMIAEHHAERRALNVRAQALLRADGTLRGDGVRIGESTFHVGDEVIARAQHRDLRPAGGSTDSYVRNGTTGVVTKIVGRAGREDLIVDFIDRGPIRVPHDWLTGQIRPGVIGGLAPAYAVTSHAAQGDTYRAGRMLASDTSQREAIYVGITRGTHDARIYMVKAEPATLGSDPQLPRIVDKRTAVEALRDQLTKTRPDELATVADPDVAQVLLLTRRPLRELEAMQHPLADRAAAIVTARVTHQAINEPGPAVLATLGERTEHPDRAAWDRAVAQAAIYHSRWNTRPATDELVAALPAHASPGQHSERRAVLDAVLDARAAQLASRPTAELAGERRQLIAHLAGTPYPDQGILRTDVHRAEDNLGRASCAAERARRDHEAAEAVRGRKRDPDRIEHTRRSLAEAEQRLDVSTVRVTEARAALDGYGDARAARDRALGRVDVIDRALEPREQQAAEIHSPYLTDALGSRPQREPHRWDAAATAIEQYRHRVLGLEPADGPLAGHGLQRAIGPLPAGQSQAWDWKRVHDATTRIHEPEIEPRVLRISR